MYFVSIAVISDEVKNAPKMLLSLLPPTALQLGVNTMAQFDSNAITFDSSCVGKKYNNYSVGNMYLMFVVDFFIYLFLLSLYFMYSFIYHEEFDNINKVSDDYYKLSSVYKLIGNYSFLSRKLVNIKKDVDAKKLKKYLNQKYSDLASFSY